MRAGARRGTPPGWPCSQAAPAELRPGTRVGGGRFVVAELLGRGGMASVYRSRDRRLGRDVALKVMLAGSARDPARTARFEHEAGLLARLPSHPGVVRLLHAGRSSELGERPFLVTALVEGPTLAFRLASDLRMPARRSVALGLGLSRALAAVHGAGVVHRDLTARNVMLDRAGEDAGPIVVDFGMAAELGPAPGSSRLTRPDQRPGTVTAMAPEQFLGCPAHPSMDVYALGRLLYEMLTAEDPHATVSLARLMERHRHGARVAPRLAMRGDAGPPALRSLVDACLEPDPARRPTAEAVAAALVEIERALERGATVLPFAGRSHASEPSPCAQSAQSAQVVAREREAPERARRTPLRAAVPTRAWPVRGAWWLVVLGAALAGVALGLGVARHASSSSDAPGLDVARWREPARLEWPTTVVPMLLPTARSRPPASAERAPAEGAASRTPAPSSRPAPIREPQRASACNEQRERAQAAARRWDWPQVLAATADRACWPDLEARTRLRLTAWIEQRRFDACVEEGADVREPTLVRLVERCRRRLAASEAPVRAGGPS